MSINNVEPTRFELVMFTRDKKGNPTGTKSFQTDSSYELCTFWNRNCTIKKKKRKKNNSQKEKFVNTNTVKDSLPKNVKQAFSDNKLNAVVDLSENPKLEG